MSPLIISLFRAAAVLIISALVTADIVSSASVPDTSLVVSSPQKAQQFRRLIPRQTQPFYRREVQSGDSVFYPRSTVVVDYGHTSAEESELPTAVVSFDSSQTHPIVVANTFDAFLKSIECIPSLSEPAPSSIISLQFNSRDSAAEASTVWSTYHRFHLITSHFGCNLDNELGAWRIHAVNHSPAGENSVVDLVAVPIALHELGTYNVALIGHTISGSWNPHQGSNTLKRRKTFTSGYSKDFSGTEILSANTGLDDDSEVPADIAHRIGLSNLNVECVECSINFNFTVDVNVTMSFLNLTALSVTATVIDFNQTILLGFSTGNELSLSYARDVFNLNLLGLQIADLVNIGPEVGISADLDLELAAGVNFTLGAKATIDPGTWATFNFLNFTESDKGWDTAKFEFVPLQVLNGTLDSTFTATVSPFIGIGITLPLGENEPLLEARITQNSPSIVISANMTTNVNRDCEPAGDNDFETFETAYELSANMTFTTHVGLVGELADDFPPWDRVFPHRSFQLYNDSGNGAGKVACFVVVGDSATTTGAASSAVMTAAPTGTLLGAASAVPSFDVSKIESYYSANGQLPTNVNYGQLAQVTSIPDGIKNPVQQAAQSQASAQAKATQTHTSGAVGSGFALGYNIVSYGVAVVLFYQVV